MVADTLKVFLRTILVVMALCLAPLQLLAQQPQFYIEVRPRSGTLNDTFHLSVVVSGARQSSPPQLGAAPDFSVQAIGPRSEIRIINGQVNSWSSYEYDMWPKRSGTLQSPSADVDIDGQHYSAAPVLVQVSSNPTAANGTAPEIFAKQSVAPGSVYVGQQTQNLVELYSSQPIRDPTLEATRIPGAIVVQSGRPERFERSYSGTRYQVQATMFAVYPLSAGKLALPERTFQAGVARRQNSRSLFDDPFGNDPFFSQFFPNSVLVEPRRFVSNPVQLEVKELPNAPSGSSLLGLKSPVVGQTTLLASMPAGDIKLGDSKTVTYTIDSVGDINSLATLPLMLPSGLRSYPSAPSVTQAQEQGLLKVRKTFPVLLVPTDPGQVIIPELNLTWFDPASASWQTAKTSALTFNVLPNSQFNPTPSAPAAPEHPLLNQMINPSARPPTIPELRYSAQNFLNRVWDRLSVGASLMIAVLVFVAGIAVWLLLHGSRVRRNRRQVLARIERAPDAGFLFEVLLQELKPFVDIQGTTLSASLQASLRQSDLPSALQFKILAHIDDLDRARFSNTHSISAAELAKLKADLTQIVLLLRALRTS